MVKVKNIAEGFYGDGELFVHPGEEIEVSAEKAEYLCHAETAGKFERVVDAAADAAAAAEKAAREKTAADAAEKAAAAAAGKEKK